MRAALPLSPRPFPMHSQTTEQSSRSLTDAQVAFQARMEDAEAARDAALLDRDAAQAALARARQELEERVRAWRVAGGVCVNVRVAGSGVVCHPFVCMRGIRGGG